MPTKIGRAAAAAKKPVTAKVPSVVTATFQFKKETPGAVAFEEVDAKGNVLKSNDAVIGGLYMRKAALGGKVPKGAEVHVTLIF